MNETNYRIAYVYKYDDLAGILQETDYGYLFTYDDAYFADNYKYAISLTMPKTQKSYESNVLFPFFDGLIPEGWLLNLAKLNWKINDNDRFGLLLVACNDPIGAVSIRGDLIE